MDGRDRIKARRMREDFEEYAWIEEGRIPYVALGRRRFLDTRELEKLIGQNTRGVRT